MTHIMPSGGVTCCAATSALEALSAYVTEAATLSGKHRASVLSEAARGLSTHVSTMCEASGKSGEVMPCKSLSPIAPKTIVSGRGYNDDRFNFSGRLPRQNVNVRVDKKDGRGKVFIVQQPNRRNNFTTIVQIDDPKGREDRYHFVLRWD